MFRIPKVLRFFSAYNSSSGECMKDLGTARNETRMLNSWFKQPKRIQRKIGYGYVLSIAIGLGGTVLGLVVTDYYQGQGVEQL